MVLGPVAFALVPLVENLTALYISFGKGMLIAAVPRSTSRSSCSEDSNSSGRSSRWLPP